MSLALVCIVVCSLLNALSVGREIAAFWSFPMSMLKNTNHLKEAKKG
jgi:hypothetical protein